MINNSGPISLGGPTSGVSVNLEVGNTAYQQISLAEAKVRTLGGIPSGPISMADLRGKPAEFILNAIIAANTFNYDVRLAALAAGWNGIVPVKANVTINSGVYVGLSYSSSGTNQSRVQTKLAAAAFDVDTLPAGSTFVLYNYGSILGCGGQGGSYLTPPAGGGLRGSQWAGGDALRLTCPSILYNYGTLGGGGGGGAGGDGGGSNSIGGGGGAGYPGGLGGFGYPAYQRSYGETGTLTNGGLGTHDEQGWVAYGGNLGVAGYYGGNFNSTGVVGQPGAYIVGNGYATWAVTGTRYGVVA